MAAAGRDEAARLRSQSLTIALLCASCDGVLFLLVVGAEISRPPVWMTLLVVLAVDGALALPARTAGKVALAQGFVRVAAAAVLAGQLPAGDTSTGNAVGLAVAGYRAGAWLTGARAWGAVAALAAGMTGAQVVERDVQVLPAVITTVANTLIPWLMGRYTMLRAGYLDELRQQLQAQRRREQEAMNRARLEERGSLARDLHDTISHHVSAIGVHAAAARLGLPAQEGNQLLRQSLGLVESSSGAAMSDLRRMLDLLHRQDLDAEVRQPGLGNLPDLVAGSRSAGLDVRLETDGLWPARLPASLDVAAHRIVQELLTNALKHGSGPYALRIQQSAEALLLTGSNAVAAPASEPPVGGRGLDGIRHRAHLFDGAVSAGPSEDGREWHTDIRLPLAAPHEAPRAGW